MKEFNEMQMIFNALPGSSGQVPESRFMGIACVLEAAQSFRVGTEKER